MRRPPDRPERSFDCDKRRKACRVLGRSTQEPSRSTVKLVLNASSLRAEHHRVAGARADSMSLSHTTRRSGMPIVDPTQLLAARTAPSMRSVDSPGT